MIRAVFQKNLISALRGEYLDFVISRLTAAIFTIASALVIFEISGGQSSAAFAQYTGSMDYRAFIIIGAALYSITMSIFLNVSRILMTELREGTIEAVFIAPFQRWRYYSGSQLAQMFLTAFDTFLCIVFAMFLRIQIQIHLPTLLIGLILLYLTMFGISCFTSLLMIYLRDTFFIQNTIFPLLILFGGYLFPVQMLPVERVLQWFPLQRAVTLIRSSLLLGENSIAPRDLIFLLSAASIAFLGLKILPRLEKYAIEHHLS
jgi:ABC-2 type transport system permease protein